MKSDTVLVKEYKPYGGVESLWKCRDREVMISGPAGTGKTRGTLEKIVLALMKYPGARALISRKTRADLTETVLVTLENHVLPDWGGWGDVQRGNRSVYHLPNGSDLVVAGWDKPGKILSGEYDIIVAHQAEELDQESWENAVSRLRWNHMPYQQAIAECNPGPPEHWLLKRVEEKRMTHIMSRHGDNPAVTPEYLELLKSTLTGHRLQRLFYGKWVAAEGLVYDAFDQVVHVKRQRRTYSRFILAIDDGFTNPLAAYLYGVDGDGRIHALREFYETKTLPDKVLTWAKRIRRAVERVSDNGLEAVIIDPSAAKLIAAFGGEGFPVIAADNSVNDGIKTVLEYLAVQKDGEPRLTIDPCCVNLLREFCAYEWARDRAGNQKDVPLKRNDHALDALRYLANYLRHNSGNWEVVVI